jgi:hypothetical protein
MGGGKITAVHCRGIHISHRARDSYGFFGAIYVTQMGRVV